MATTRVGPLPGSLSRYPSSPSTASSASVSPRGSRLSLHSLDDALRTSADAHSRTPHGPAAVVVEVEGRVEAPVQVVWKVISRSSRNNRLVGRKAVRVADVPSDPFAKDVAFVDGSLHWRERPASWVTCSSYVTSRVYKAGSVRRSIIDVTMQALLPSATRVRYVITLYPRTVAGRLLLMCVGRARLPDFLGLLRKLAAEAQGAPPDAGLVRRRGRPVTSQQVHAREQRCAALRIACGGNNMQTYMPIAQLLMDLVSSGYDEDVNEMRAFEIADAWGVDRRALLTVFLFAVRAGLLSISWVISCPNCAGAASNSSTLNRLPQLAVHCGTCKISVATDADESVELRFSAHADVRGAAEKDLYCPNDPSAVSFALVQLGFAHGGSREFELELPNEELVMRDLISQSQVRLLPDGKPGAMLSVDMSSALVPRGSMCYIPGIATYEDESSAQHFAPGLVCMRVSTRGAALVRLERSDWHTRGVRPSYVAGLEAFRSLIPPEHLDQGKTLTVSAMAFVSCAGEGVIVRAARAKLEAQGGVVVRAIATAVTVGFAAGVDRALEALLSIQELGQFRSGIAAGSAMLLLRDGAMTYDGDILTATEGALRYAAPGEIVALRSALSSASSRHVLNLRGVDTVDIGESSEVRVAGSLTARDYQRLVMIL